MNENQLNKINKKKSELERICDILSNENKLRYILVCRQDVPHKREELTVIPTEIIESALVVYRDKLKSELKELGYEEEQ